MRSGSNDQQTVNEVAARVPGARSVLRAYRIDPSDLPLSVAAAMTSTTTDELLAVADARARRAARAARRFRELPREEEELVA